MNGTTDTADLSSGISDARLREWRLILNFAKTVSNNLGVYFLLCLFVLAILALFPCRSMQTLQTSLFFFVLRRQVWQVFKSKPQKTPGPKFSLQNIPCQISKSLKISRKHEMIYLVAIRT